MSGMMKMDCSVAHFGRLDAAILYSSRDCCMSLESLPKKLSPAQPTTAETACSTSSRIHVATRCDEFRINEAVLISHDTLTET